MRSFADELFPGAILETSDWNAPYIFVKEIYSDGIVRVDRFGPSIYSRSALWRDALYCVEDLLRDFRGAEIKSKSFTRSVLDFWAAKNE